MHRADLLRYLAASLHATANAHVEKVLAGDDVGVAPHVASFIRAQRPLGPAGFQLPEPILGPIPEHVAVLVIGLNPGYGSTEDIPTVRSSLN